MSICLIVLLFSIIVPFIVSSVATFLESADDYNNKVLILIDLAISELKKFDIDIDRETITKFTKYICHYLIGHQLF